MLKPSPSYNASALSFTLDDTFYNKRGHCPGFHQTHGYEMQCGIEWD